MKGLKIATTILMVILLILAIACLLIGGFMPLFSIAFGLLFLYYALVFAIVLLAIKREKNVYMILAYVVFFLPILWTFWDYESLLNFLLQGIELDMK
ncbi:hypothetical protein [Flagellimonas sp.]|uniref:hypothetical protein n=1 Tax=Flagellimonas sp. TaxID=2058762 RepID=UPI003F4A24A8